MTGVTRDDHTPNRILWQRVRNVASFRSVIPRNPDSPKIIAIFSEIDPPALNGVIGQVLYQNVCTVNNLR